MFSWQGGRTMIMAESATFDNIEQLTGSGRPGKRSARELLANRPWPRTVDTQTQLASEAGPSNPGRLPPSGIAPPIPRWSAGNLPWPRILYVVVGGAN